MGCCGGDAVDAEDRKRNSQIDKQLRADQERMNHEVKLLLLGAGDSGKSTILKQMKFIHDNGYSKEDREAFREVVNANVIQSMHAVVEAMPNLDLDFSNPENKEHAQTILDQPRQEEIHTLPAAVTTALISLWKDDGVREAVLRSNEFQLHDSAQYYFDSLDRITASNYIPDDQDILRTRVKTTGISETTFKVESLTYRMFDVGGQRSERKKWIHCFENVTAVVFVVALSAYDQMLLEDEAVVRLLFFSPRHCMLTCSRRTGYKSPSPSLTPFATASGSQRPPSFFS